MNRKCGKRLYKILGTKDYINYKLTGKILTDYSYASVQGFTTSKSWKYDETFIDASGIPAEVWPNIVPSTHILGEVVPEVAKLLGLSNGVQVVCGGVDNFVHGTWGQKISQRGEFTPHWVPLPGLLFHPSSRCLISSINRMCLRM